MRSTVDDAGPGRTSIEESTSFDLTDAVSLSDEMAAARATQYLLLANLFSRAPSDALLRDMARLRGDASPLGLALLALADASQATDPTAVAKEYLSLFIGVSRGDILPYASFYLTGFLHERPLARVREDMTRLNIERRSGVFEPEDHIASLFEIMAGLIGGSMALPGQSGKAADKFFERHIAPWAPRLMQDVAAAPSANFYAHVARLGAVWLEIEQEAVRMPE